MTESNEPVEPGEEDFYMMQFIVLSRIYDVLMTQLMVDDAEKGEHLLGLHAEGGLLMPEPTFNGVFVTSAASATDSTPR